MANNTQAFLAYIEHGLFYVRRMPISPKYVPSLINAMIVLSSDARTCIMPYLIKYILVATSPRNTTKLSCRASSG